MDVTTRQLRQLGRADEGQALVLTALALVVLMLMAGLGVDVGFLRYQKQQMQKAADAGAIAGASALIYGGNYVNAGRNDTSANGFTNGSNGISVAVNNPPKSGPNQNSNYVEVIVSQAQPTFFMKVGGFFSVPVSARAVASAAGSASGCIYVLDPSDSDSYLQSGSTRVTSACGILVNSANAKGFDQNDSTACTTASYIGIHGSSYTGTCFPSPGKSPLTNLPSFTDPLVGLTEPTSAGCKSYSTTNINKTEAISQGTYCGGININGGTVTLNPGTYIMDGGGFTVSGGSTTVLGSGVTIYLTGYAHGGSAGQVTISGGATAQLSAPTSDTYSATCCEGMLFWEDRNIPWSYGSAHTSQVTGSSSSFFTGALYFPTTTLTYSGGSTLAAYTTIVAYKLDVTGPSTINDNYSSLSDGASPIHSAALAE